MDVMYQLIVFCDHVETGGFPCGWKFHQQPVSHTLKPLQNLLSSTIYFPLQFEKVSLELDGLSCVW